VPRSRALIAGGVAFGAIVALLVLRAVLYTSPWDQLHDDGGGRYTGTIELPRPGRYVFGNQGAAPMVIVVAGQRVPLRVERDLPGVWTGPLDLDAGVVTFVVDAPRGVRLLWHPPGRRGPPEYLPASVLDPGSTWAGARPLDGLVALGIVLVLAGLVVFLLWPRLRALERDQVLAVAAVFALALGVRLWDLGGAGQTFDEDVTWSAGRNQVANAVDLDLRQRSWIWNYQHPPVTKDLAGIGAQLADGYGPARSLSALEMALACALIVAIGRRCWSLRAGLGAGVAAALSPHLIAHGQIVGHEAPTVLWWTLALWLCLRAFDADPDRRRLALRFAGIGVVLGLAISTRWVNALLAPMIGATLLLTARPGYLRRTLALGAAIIPAVALVTCVVVWPRLWSDPIAHLRAAQAIVSKGHGAEQFLGRMTEHPSHVYFLAYLFATAPIGILLGVVAFAVRAVLRRRREWRSSLFAVLLFAIPLLAELSPVRQDGVRYVMPSLVALALMAGAGLDLVPGRWFRAALATFALYLAIVCALIHPYYLDYYGEQVGGPSGVAARRDFELGWWGEGVADAVTYVDTHAAPEDRVYRDCIDAVHLAWWSWPVWQHLARKPAEADWIVVQPAYRACPIPPGFTVEHTVTAMGAPLVRIYHRSPDP
jgi:4-amino-4-deoxy-L-arabinose transferase-like glycosyltransferase